MNAVLPISANRLSLRDLAWGGPLESVEAVIVYNLRCKNGHEFEGWFRDSDAYEAQSSDGKLACPACNSSRIEKAIMAPSLAGVRDSEIKRDQARQSRQFMTGLRKYVQENAEYVGPKFAEEARKIHYGETVDRHIYGETSLEEARELIEEGVDVAPLPPDIEGAN